MPRAKKNLSGKALTTLMSMPKNVLIREAFNRNLSTEGTKEDIARRIAKRSPGKKKRTPKLGGTLGHYMKLKKSSLQSIARETKVSTEGTKEDIARRLARRSPKARVSRRRRSAMNNSPKTLTGLMRLKKTTLQQKARALNRSTEGTKRDIVLRILSARRSRSPSVRRSLSRSPSVRRSLSRSHSRSRSVASGFSSLDIGSIPSSRGHVSASRLSRVGAKFV